MISCKVLAVLVSLFSVHTSEMLPYILGGQYAKIEQFPHSVYLSVTCDGVSWSCGASILNQNIVLTAAHCLKHCHRDLDIVVYAGSEHVNQIPVSRNVSLYMLHESFDAISSRNDIALAHTESALPLGTTIKRVTVTEWFPRVKTAQVAGWGVINEATQQESALLQWLPQSIGSRGHCERFTLWPGVMCVQNTISSRPTRGNSGCALLSNYVHQIGLLSFRHPQLVQLIFYTNVSYYYSWIQKNAKKLNCFIE